MKLPQLINRMENEGDATSADVFLTADAVNLILAKKKGLLTTYPIKCFN